MSEGTKHLTEEDFMLLLKEIPIKKFFWLSFKSHSDSLLKKNKQIHEHLLECPACLYELWESYYTLSCLAKEKAKISFPRLLLTVDSIKSSFGYLLQEGFLVPVNARMMPSLRTLDEISKSKIIKDLVSVDYVFRVPHSTNMLKFRISSESDMISFAFAKEKKDTQVWLISLFTKNNLTETQNLKETQFQTQFLLPVNDLSRQPMTRFLLTTPNIENYVLLELSFV